MNKSLKEVRERTEENADLDIILAAILQIKSVEESEDWAILRELAKKPGFDVLRLREQINNQVEPQIWQKVVDEFINYRVEGKDACAMSVPSQVQTELYASVMLETERELRKHCVFCAKCHKKPGIVTVVSGSKSTTNSSNTDKYCFQCGKAELARCKNKRETRLRLVKFASDDSN